MRTPSHKDSSCGVPSALGTAQQPFTFRGEGARPGNLSLDGHVPREKNANLKFLRLKKLSLDGHALRKEHCESEGAHPATPHQQMFHFRRHVPNALYRRITDASEGHFRPRGSREGFLGDFQPRSGGRICFVGLEMSFGGGGEGAGERQGESESYT